MLLEKKCHQYAKRKNLYQNYTQNMVNMKMFYDRNSAKKKRQDVYFLFFPFCDKNVAEQPRLNDKQLQERSMASTVSVSGKLPGFLEKGRSHPTPSQINQKISRPMGFSIDMLNFYNFLMEMTALQTNMKNTRALRIQI